MDWLTVVGSYAFPIVACIGMGWWTKYTSDRNREDMKEMQKSHTEETKELRESLEKMNTTLTELVTLWKQNDNRKDDVK